MPELLNNIQTRVERSVFEAIRLKLVFYGYLPDETNTATYPNTPAGSDQFQTDMQAIAQAKGFAVEVFGHGSSLSKGIKRVPRLAIIARRIMPGDIGKNISGGFSPNPLDPDSTQKLIPSLQSANFHLDINLIPANAAQDRVMHSIIGEAISTLSYIPMWDDPKELFLIRQFNFYDLPDDKNGLEEKAYSYEVPDLYIYEGKVITDIPIISQITVNTTVQELQTILTRTGSLIGPFQGDEGIFMDLSGISYKLP